MSVTGRPGRRPCDQSDHDLCNATSKTHSNKNNNTYPYRIAENSYALTSVKRLNPQLWPLRQPVRQCPPMPSPLQLPRLHLQNGRHRQPPQTRRTMISTMCGVSPTPGRSHTDPRPGHSTCSPSCRQSGGFSLVTIRESSPAQ